MGQRPHFPRDDSHDEDESAMHTPTRASMGRRHLLQATGGLLAAAGISRSAHAAQDDPTTQLAVTQGEKTHIVEPLSGPHSAEGFYNRQNGSSYTQTGLERTNTSLLFFWEGPNGELSLVTIHDHPSNETGGRVRLNFDGLPTDQGEWVVMDDTLQHGNDFDGPTDTDVEWAWTGGYNDGGVFQGGLGDEFEITITPDFNNNDEEHITSWQLLSGSHVLPERISLSRDDPVTITPHTEAETDQSTGTSNDSETTAQTTDDYAAIQALVPTHVNGTEPGKLRNEQMQTEWLWAMRRVGDEWPSTGLFDSPFSDDEPPEWVTKFEDNPDDSRKYVRVPAFLTVTSTVGDDDTVLFRNVEIRESGLRCLGVEDNMLPDKLTPGKYQFYIVLKLSSQVVGEIGNYVGSFSLDVDVPEDSPVREAARNHPRWSDADGLTVSSKKYTAPYSVQDEYSEALKQGMSDLIWLLQQSVSTLSSFTMGGTALPLRSTIKNAGGTIITGQVSQYIDPNHIIGHDTSPLNAEDIDNFEEVSVAGGTTFLRGETEDGDAIGLSGPMLTVAATPLE